MCNVSWEVHVYHDRGMDRFDRLRHFLGVLTFCPILRLKRFSFFKILEDLDFVSIPYCISE